MLDRSKFPTADDEYTAAQPRVIDARLAKSDEDIKHGRVYGPFNTHKDFMSDFAHRREGRNSAQRKSDLSAYGPMRLLFTPLTLFAPSTKRRVPIQRAFEKQSLSSCFRTLRHPFPARKKIQRSRRTDGKRRVNQDWRFYFRIENDAYILTDIMCHPK